MICSIYFHFTGEIWLWHSKVINLVYNNMIPILIIQNNYNDLYMQLYSYEVYSNIKLPRDIGTGSSGKSSNSGVGEDVSTATKTSNSLDWSKLKPNVPIGCTKNSDASKPSV